jgi:ABC-2 type transport system permease protein
MKLLVAELRKASTLRAVWVGLAVTLVGTVGVTLLNAQQIRSALAAGRGAQRAFTSPLETAFAIMPLGTVGAVVIGVVLFSSEYTTNSTDSGGSRQIITSLVATPQRVRLLAAKAITVVLFVLAMAAVTLPLAIGIAKAMIGDAAPETVGLTEAVSRCLGGTVYWVLSGLIGLAVTVMIRNGLVPLIVMIVNSSVVSVSLLLSKLTPLAQWLPDLAGRRLFGPNQIEGGLSAVPGGSVMAGWTLAFCAAAAVVFTRRDA